MPEQPPVRAERTRTAALLDSLRATLGDDLLEAVSAADMDEAAIVPNALMRAVEILRAAGFNMLADIGVVDHHPLSPRFEVAYHIHAIDAAAKPVVPARFRLRVFPDDAEPVVPSLVSVWPNANWAEREAFDLFGVRFDGHINLKRILMPDDWVGYPLRKDYPLRGTDRGFVAGGRQGSVPPVSPRP